MTSGDSVALKGFGHPIGNDTAMFPLLGESLNHHGVFSGKDFHSVLKVPNHMALKNCGCNSQRKFLGPLAGRHLAAVSYSKGFDSLGFLGDCPGRQKGEEE